MIHDKARVEGIRAKVHVQIALIDTLKSKIVKGELEALDVARNQTQDIEALFLDDLEGSERSPAQEARWFSSAEQMLETWTPYLRKTEQQFEQFGGRGMQIMGG